MLVVILHVFWSLSAIAESGCELLSIRLFHSGRFVDNHIKAYVGGEEDFVDECNPDTISIHEICTMSWELGHSGSVLFYYLEPESNLDHGLRELLRDSDILGCVSAFASIN